MVWTLLLIAHVLGLVGYTILLRKSALGALNKLVLTAVMQVGVLAPSFAFLFLGYVSFVHTPVEWMLMFLAGVVLSGLMLTNVWALSRLDASLFTLLYNLRLLIVTVLAFVFLGELPSSLQMVGGLIILMSIVILNLHIDGRWRSTPILIGLFSMFWFSGHAVFEKFNLGLIDIYSYIFFISLVSAMVLWAAIFVLRIDMRGQLQYIFDSKIGILILTRAVSAYAYIFALLYGSLAVTNYVSGMSVALVVLSGIYFLNEREDIPRKLFAVAVACVGLTLIFLGGLSP